MIGLIFLCLISSAATYDVYGTWQIKSYHGATIYDSTVSLNLSQKVQYSQIVSTFNLTLCKVLFGEVDLTDESVFITPQTYQVVPRPGVQCDPTQMSLISQLEATYNRIFFYQIENQVLRFRDPERKILAEFIRTPKAVKLNGIWSLFDANGAFSENWVSIDETKFTTCYGTMVYNYTITRSNGISLSKVRDGGCMQAGYKDINTIFGAAAYFRRTWTTLELFDDKQNLLIAFGAPDFNLYNPNNSSS